MFIHDDLAMSRTLMWKILL